MSFFDDLLKLLSSLFSGKKEETVQQEEQKEEVKVNTNDYVIPSGVKNMLEIMRVSQNLTDTEMADLENQIRTMGSLGFTNYVIHTHDRGETSKFYPLTGDRFWELNYLKGAGTMDVITDGNGMSREVMQDKGLEPLVYENLLS